MRKKIVFLPLDERPCNAKFPLKLFETGGLELVTPPQLGNKKQPAPLAELAAFLKRECADADGLVVAMDMLLYGGLVPSRLHNLAEGEVAARLAVMEELKRDNPKLVVYAYQTIMRCPRYSDADEEPAYYDAYGREIWEIGVVRHQYQLGLCDDGRLRELYDSVDSADLQDYLSRRAFNLRFVCSTLKLVQRGLVDFMILPQDDSSPYGFTAMDQQEARNQINAAMLQDRVLLYPGADEIGLVLTARMALHFAQKTPRVFVRYASVAAPGVVPQYEDRTLGETIKAQILAIGCRCAYAPSEADFVLAVTCPAGDMRETVLQPAESPCYNVERNLPELLFFMEDCVLRGIPVAVCDNAYTNGGELALVRLMNQRGLLQRVAGYAGWGTSSNTLGTALAQGVHHLLCGMDAAHRRFLTLRYLEDAAYCSKVRRDIIETLLPEWGLDASDTGEKTASVCAAILERLREFCENELPGLAPGVTIQNAGLPWRRMFEVDLDVAVTETGKEA